MLMHHQINFLEGGGGEGLDFEKGGSPVSFPV